MGTKTIDFSDEQNKELLKEVLIELIQTKRDIFYEILLEALEEIALGNAIAEGRKNDFISEEDLFLLLDEN